MVENPSLAHFSMLSMYQKTLYNYSKTVGVRKTKLLVFLSQTDRQTHGWTHRQADSSISLETFVLKGIKM